MNRQMGFHRAPWHFGILLSCFTILEVEADTLTRVSFRSPFVNCDVTPESGESIFTHAEVEPVVAVNPRNPQNMVGSWQQDLFGINGSRGFVNVYSFDGGEYWQPSHAHFSRCSGGNSRNGGNYERAADAWLSFSPNGTLYQISLSFNMHDAGQAMLVSRSFDGGKSWTEPHTLIHDTVSTIVDDKETITADPTDSRYAYAVWSRLRTNAERSEIYKGPTVFTRTRDAGVTWERPVTIYDPGPGVLTLANQIGVLADGTIVNMFARGTKREGPIPNEVVLIRSTDRGTTWSAPIVINTLGTIGINDYKTGARVRTGDIIPDLAVAPKTNTIYAVWQDARFSGYKRDGIALARSDDGGLSWTDVMQVNKATNVQAFTAAVDVADDGTVAVTYYDFRRDKPAEPGLATDMWSVVSHDQGKTWTEHHVGGPFDMTAAVPMVDGYFVGDYEGLAHRGNDFVNLFVMANKRSSSRRTDVYFSSGEQEEDSDFDDHVEIKSYPESQERLLNSALRR